jgi:hypothetical protein
MLQSFQHLVTEQVGFDSKIPLSSSFTSKPLFGSPVPESLFSQSVYPHPWFLLNWSCSTSGLCQGSSERGHM